MPTPESCTLNSTAFSTRRTLIVNVVFRVAELDRVGDEVEHDLLETDIVGDDIVELVRDRESRTTAFSLPFAAGATL